MADYMVFNHAFLSKYWSIEKAVLFLGYMFYLTGMPFVFN